jgi:hypothetical protein
MQSIFDKIKRDELIMRIHTLSEKSKAQWGKMNVYEMVKHCVICEEYYLGSGKLKRSLRGIIFGKIRIKNLSRDETPIERNAPTNKHFISLGATGDIEAEKLKWISLIKKYENYPNDNFVHWFFGKMTKEQIGYFVYKHTDHHLRQFNS